MLRLITRWIILGILGCSVILVTTSLIGRVINPYPMLMSYEFSQGNIQTLTYFDLPSQVRYSVSTDASTYQMTFTQRIGYRTEYIDEQTLIYTKHMWQRNDRLIATIPTESRWIATQWTYNFDDPFYLVDTLRSEPDTIAVYQIEMTTGDYSLIGTYPFEDSSVQSVYFYRDNIMLFRGAEGTTVLLNTDTDEVFAQKMNSYNSFGMPEQSDMVYTTSEFVGGDTPTMVEDHFILNMDTFEQSEIALPDAEGVESINIRFSKPDDDKILIVDNLDHLWLYDVSDQAYQALPSDYLHIEGAYGWHPDREHLFLAKIIAEDEDSVTVAFGLYTVETDSFAPIFTETERSIHVILNQSRSMQFSPDGNYLIVIENAIHVNRQRDLYDVNTGELLFDEEMLFIADNGFLTWGYVPRPIRNNR